MRDREDLFEKSGNIRVLAFFAVAFFIISFILFPMAKKTFTGSGGGGSVQLQMAFTRERFADTIKTWNENKPEDLSFSELINNWHNTVQYLDFVFPIVYVGMFSSAIALITKKLRFNKPEDKGGKRQAREFGLAKKMFAAVYFAGLFDWVENDIHLRLVAGLTEDIAVSKLDADSVLIASIIASLKFIIIGIAIVYIISKVKKYRAIALPIKSS